VQVGCAAAATRIGVVLIVVLLLLIVVVGTKAVEKERKQMKKITDSFILKPFSQDR
jgi:hypothetical protein